MLDKTIRWISKQQLHGWQANAKGTCASPAVRRALPENEIPPVFVVVAFLRFLRDCFHDNTFWSLRYPTQMCRVIPF